MRATRAMAEARHHARRRCVAVDAVDGRVECTAEDGVEDRQRRDRAILAPPIGPTASCQPFPLPFALPPPSPSPPPRRRGARHRAIPLPPADSWPRVVIASQRLAARDVAPHGNDLRPATPPHQPLRLYSRHLGLIPQQWADRSPSETGPDAFTYEQLHLCITWRPSRASPAQQPAARRSNIAACAGPGIASCTASLAAVERLSPVAVCGRTRSSTYICNAAAGASREYSLLAPRRPVL